MSKIVAIKENHLFSKVYAKGKKASEKNIAVYALRNYKSGDTCLGITTGKKLGNAVERSRARRLIREAFRACSREKQWKKPYWIIVVARSSIVSKDRKMDHVRQDLEKAFSKLDLFLQKEES
jgi:ribonuclease P protein component